MFQVMLNKVISFFFAMLFNFSYTLVDADAPLPDDSSTGRGAISYILSGVAIHFIPNMRHF